VEADFSPGIRRVSSEELPPGDPGLLGQKRTACLGVEAQVGRSCLLQKWFSGDRCCDEDELLPSQANRKSIELSRAGCEEAMHRPRFEAEKHREESRACPELSAHRQRPTWTIVAAAAAFQSP
jgi:hypothetical protein